MRARAALVSLALSLTAATSAVADPPPPAQFVDPCVRGSGAKCPRALDGFYRALAATEAGTASHAVRITYLGDSLSADDWLAQRLRDALVPRFGDGGPGFVHVVPPHKFCRARTVKRTASASWKLWGVATPFPADRLLGYGGGSVESQGGATVKFSPRTPGVTLADVYYLAQPGGGTLTATVDGAEVATIDSSAAAKKASFAVLPVPAAVGKLELRASGRVRLFGVVLEAPRGVVVDNLGVVNATARSWAKNRRDHFQGQAAHRAPDLFVVMIGANEAGWLAGDDLAGYHSVLADLVAPVKKANPDAACLLISPFDQLAWNQKGSPPRAAIPAMVEANRAAAAAVGCGFWDAYAWMGGAGSSRQWRKAGWLTNDFTHPSPSGNARIGAALAAGLLEGYAAFRGR